jgi:hypothetical protein
VVNYKPFSGAEELVRNHQRPDSAKSSNDRRVVRSSSPHDGDLRADLAVSHGRYVTPRSRCRDRFSPIPVAERPAAGALAPTPRRFEKGANPFLHNSDGAPNPRQEWTFGIHVRDLDSARNLDSDGNQESVRDLDDDRHLTMITISMVITITISIMIMIAISKIILITI